MAPDLLADFPPHVLREYAFVGDGERGALIGPRGDVCWMCAPGWASDAVFATLIGGQGGYGLTPTERATWGGHYDRRSLIWNSRWVTTAGIVESREALALPADPHTAVLLRRVRVLAGAARIRVTLDVRPGFGTEPMGHTRRDEGGTWSGRAGGLWFRWSGAGEGHRAGAGPLVVDLVLRAGDTHDLVLEVGDVPPAAHRPSADKCWAETETHWRRAVPVIDEPALAPRDAEQAMAVLVGLTSASGGMAAAATTSLPERARQGRNYDYRYAWIRDQTFAGLAAAAHHHDGLLDSAVGFVADRLLADGPQLKPAYTVDGRPVPDQRPIPGLSGYPGASDRVGNWVNQQFQLDTFGEALELLAAASRAGRLDRDHWRAAQVAADAIEQRGHEPDAGVWEIEPRRWAHSRLTCVSGLRAIAAEAPGTESGRWSALADAMLAEVSADCLHPGGRWQRAPDDPRVDAALLLPIVRSGLAPSDPRSAATVDAVAAQLMRQDYVYRFRHDDRPLDEAEGAFVLCGFLLALAQAGQGRTLEARVLFERNRSACGSPGLLAEEFDVVERQLRGNLPQAFVHALLLECSATLAATTRL